MTDHPTAGVALKPCPFCDGLRGTPAVSSWLMGTADELQTKADQYGYQVRCICGAAGPDTGDETSAATAWNTRTPASDPVTVPSGVREANDSRLFSVVSMLERVIGPTDSVRICAHEAKIILSALATRSGRDVEDASSWKAEAEAHAFSLDVANREIERLAARPAGGEGEARKLLRDAMVEMSRASRLSPAWQAKASALLSSLATPKEDEAWLDELERLADDSLRVSSGPDARVKARRYRAAAHPATIKRVIAAARAGGAKASTPAQETER